MHGNRLEKVASKSLLLCRHLLLYGLKVVKFATDSTTDTVILKSEIKRHEAKGNDMKGNGYEVELRTTETKTRTNTTKKQRIRRRRYC